MRTVLLLFLSAWYGNYTVTQIVDDMEPRLRANRDAFLAGPHTLARAEVALAYFDQQWTWLQSADACGSKLLRQAGARCLADRSRSGQWPWEVYYRDPIVNSNPR
jgi:hypothetical protein